MGLDQHLYRTSKRRLEAERKFNQLREDFNQEVTNLMEKPKWKGLISSLPKNEFGYYDWKSYTKEQKKGVRNFNRACRRSAKKFGLKLNSSLQPIFNIGDFGLNSDDELEELGYWRKEWDLHNYIIGNFLDPAAPDNLVEVHLSKADLEKIVSDGYVGAFKDALDRWDDDYDVFYWPWY